MTSRVIRDRLFREAEGNVALRVEQPPNSARLCRRGPRRIAARDPHPRPCAAKASSSASRGRRCFSVEAPRAKSWQPVEEVVIDVDEEHSGVVVQKMSERKGEMILWGAPRAAAGCASLFPCPADPRPDRLPRRTDDRHPQERR